MLPSPRPGSSRVPRARLLALSREPRARPGSFSSIAIVDQRQPPRRLPGFGVRASVRVRSAVPSQPCLRPRTSEECSCEPEAMRLFCYMMIKDLRSYCRLGGGRPISW